MKLFSVCFFVFAAGLSLAAEEPTLSESFFDRDKARQGRYEFREFYFHREKQGDEAELSSVIALNIDSHLSRQYGTAFYKNELRLKVLAPNRVHVEGTWLDMAIDAETSLDEKKSTVTFKSRNPHLVLHLDQVLVFGEPAIGYVGDVKRRVTLKTLGYSGELRNRWMSAVCQLTTIFAESLRKQDTVFRRGDVVWFEDEDGQIRTALVNTDDIVGEEEANVIVKAGSSGREEAVQRIEPKRWKKPVDRLNGLRTGQIVRWGNLFPKNVRIDFLLSDGTAWVTLLSDRKIQKITSVDTLFALEPAEKSK